MDDKLLDLSMCRWTGKIGGKPTEWPVGTFAAIASWTCIFLPVLLGIVVGILTQSWAWGLATPFIFTLALAVFVYLRFYWPPIEILQPHPAVQKQLEEWDQW